MRAVPPRPTSARSSPIHLSPARISIWGGCCTSWAACRRPRRCIARDALLHYNLGVLLEDLGRRKAALEAYREALQLQDDLADCHYNISLLYQASGMKAAALRHLSAYRRLQSG